LIERQKTPPGTSPLLDLDRWSVLARRDNEVLFGHGLPPELVTIAMRLDARRDTWRSIVVLSNPTRSASCFCV
jgi:hypothetical protein